MASLFRWLGRQGKKLYGWVWAQEKRLYKWTWVKTKSLCKPEREDYSDLPSAPKGYKPISNSYMVRAGAGYLIWVVLRLLGYLIPGPDIITFGQSFYISAPLWMTSLSIIAVSAGLYAITDEGAKSFTLSRLTIPAMRALILVPPTAVIILITWLASSPGANSVWGLENWSPRPGPLTDALGQLSSIVGIVILPLWLVICLWPLFATFNLVAQLYWCNFRTIDGHPYLGSISTITSVWAVVAYDAVVNGPTKTFRPDTQLWLQLAANWGGPVILSAIAVTEITWLWHHARRRPSEGSIPPPIKTTSAA